MYYLAYKFFDGVLETGEHENGSRQETHDSWRHDGGASGGAVDQAVVRRMDTTKVIQASHVNFAYHLVLETVISFFM